MTAGNLFRHGYDGRGIEQCCFHICARLPTRIGFRSGSATAGPTSGWYGGDDHRDGFFTGATVSLVEDLAGVAATSVSSSATNVVVCLAPRSRLNWDRAAWHVTGGNVLHYGHDPRRNQNWWPGLHLFTFGISLRSQCR